MFDRVEGLIGKETLDKIKTKTVMIVGIGGVGGNAVEALIRSGIQNIIIIDSDSVEVTNLNRQIISTQEVIGRKKVDVCTERIKSINPSCNVTALNLFLDEKNLVSVLDDYKPNYIIDACDTVLTKQALIKESIKRKIKLISCLGTGNKLDPTMLELTDIRKTVNDPLARKLRKWVKDEQIKEKIMVLSSRELPVKRDKVYTMCFVPNVAGIMLANYVIRNIIEEK